MIWFQLMFFFTIWTAVVIMVFEAFARLVYIAARLSLFFSHLLGFLLAVPLVALSCFAPSSILEFVLGQAILNASIKSAVMAGSMGCMSAGLIVFLRRHMYALKEAGYY